MEWIKYPENKPEFDCICFVSNTKSGFNIYQATYFKRYDYFKWDNENLRNPPALEVTHYIELPDFPKAKRENAN